MPAISAKAVLIVVGPFVVLARDYAGDFTLRKLLKGDGLHKNDRAGDLFGVAADALSRGSKEQRVALPEESDFSVQPLRSL